MKQRNKLIIGAILIVVVIFAAVMVYKAAAQEQSADLEVRLKQAGIPVLEVKMINLTPYEVKIRILSDSEEAHILPDDIWNLSAARRQAKLSQRFGINLDRALLCLENQKGEELICETAVVQGADAMNETIGAEGLNAFETKTLLLTQFDFNNLSVDSFDVDEDEEENLNGLNTEIVVTGKTIEAVNQDLPLLIESIKIFIDTKYALYDLNLDLIHLRVLDETGRVLFDYVQDVDTGMTTLTQTTGIDSGLISSPGQSMLTPVPTSIPPTQAYPAPEQAGETAYP